MATNNLFYQLYGTTNNYINVGYVCDSAIDETETSFDITDSAGQITDSNGDILAEIPLDDIHVNPITDYASDTKVLNPGSNIILQGPENGDSYKNQEFPIPGSSNNDSDNINSNDPNTDLTSDPNYPYYIDVNFDLDYNGIPVHIDTSAYPRDPQISTTDILQNIFDCLGIPVSVSLVDSSCSKSSLIDCNCDCEDSLLKSKKVFKFLSEQAGYSFNISNFYISPIICSSSAIDSPYTEPEITYEAFEDIYDTYKEILNMDSSTIISFYDYLVTNFQTLKENLNNDDPDNYQFEEYDEDIIKEFFKDLIIYIGYQEDGSYIKPVLASNELICNKVDSNKYPNGAMRGLIIVPQYPDSYDSQALSLKLVHLKDNIYIFNAIDCSNALDTSHYIRKEYEVISNQQAISSVIVKNKSVDCNTLCAKCGDSSCSTLINLCVFNRENEQEENSNTINLQQFLNYVTENNMWIKFGQLYAIIAQADDENTNERNLIPSVFIYNPNDFPIKIKYMVFN